MVLAKLPARHCNRLYLGDESILIDFTQDDKKGYFQLRRKKVKISKSTFNVAEEEMFYLSISKEKKLL